MNLRSLRPHYARGRNLLLGCALLLVAPAALSAAAAPSPRVLLSSQLAGAKVPDLSPEARQNMLDHIAATRAAKQARRQQAQKVDSALRQLASQDEQLLTAPGPHPVLQADATSVRLEIRFTGPAQPVLKALAELGLRVEVSLDDHGMAVVTAARAGLDATLDRLEGMAAVRSVRPVVRGVRSTGSVTSEGDAAHKADQVRTLLGVDGTGTRVCVISDGTDGAADAQASGDLPASLDLCPLNDNEGSEGTAMLEIIHDLAPGAELGFCPGFGNGQAGLAAAVTYLANDAFGGQGCDIIVDDLFDLTEPYFQDGVIAQAIDTAAAGGTLYFTAAGNFAEGHYENRYRDTSPGFDGVFGLDLHDWGLASGAASDTQWGGIIGGTAFAPFNVFIAVLQWNDPFGASDNDYDLYIFDQNGFPAGAGDFPIGANGIDPQTGVEDPIELAFILNDNAPVLPFFLVIDRFAGNGRVLEINTNPNLASLITVPEDYTVAEGSIAGHSAANGALTIAATGAVDNIDGTPNPDLDIIEPFSARGPARIYFDANGNRRFQLRLKPEYTAVDGTSVSGAGGFPSPFFGTSAAAPHAAAIAALVLDAGNGHLGPLETALILGITAKPRAPFDTWGFGLLNALRAARLASLFAH